MACLDSFVVLNNDGILDVRDATALQLYIAESATLDIEGVKMADINTT